MYPRFWLYPHLDKDEYINWVMHAQKDFDQTHILEWSIKRLHKRERLNIYTDYLSDTITCMKYEALF